jgi:hypothetical protein
MPMPFLDLAVSKVQQASHWPAHHWNVMSEQRKSHWQHPETDYRQREKAPRGDETDAGQDPHP